MAVTVNGDRHRARLNEFLFIKIEEGDLATFGFNRTALCATQPKLDVLRPEVVWPSRDYNLTPLDYYVLWDVVKDKCLKF